VVEEAATIPQEPPPTPEGAHPPPEAEPQSLPPGLRR